MENLKDKKIFTNIYHIESLNDYVGKKYNYTYSLNDIIRIFLSLNNKYSVSFKSHIIGSGIYININEQHSDRRRTLERILTFKYYDLKGNQKVESEVTEILREINITYPTKRFNFEIIDYFEQHLYNSYYEK